MAPVALVKTGKNPLSVVADGTGASEVDVAIKEVVASGVGIMSGTDVVVGVSVVSVEGTEVEKTANTGLVEDAVVGVSIVAIEEVGETEAVDVAAYDNGGGKLVDGTGVEGEAAALEGAGEAAATAVVGLGLHCPAAETPIAPRAMVTSVMICICKIFVKEWMIQKLPARRLKAPSL